MLASFRIGKYSIGPNEPPFIIAELSANHNQSFERAKELVRVAAQSGVHAIKLQTYRAETMTLDLKEGVFSIHNEASLWKGESLYELYQKAATPWDWHQPLFEYAQSLGLLAFSSPFDRDAIDFLDKLNVPAFKIASFELVDLPLIRYAAKKGRPMILSTGMATVSEIEDAVEAVRSEGNFEIALLKCTSTYPSSPENSNLRTIPHLQSLFNTIVGLSDHTLGIGAAVGAVTLGASIIEKHFTLSRKEGGFDSAFSLEPHELRSLVEETRTAWQALGSIQYGASEKEKSSLQFRRSIYVSRDIKKGEVFSPENVRIIRPGYGLAPKFLDQVIGRKANGDMPKGSPLSWEKIGE